MPGLGPRLLDGAEARAGLAIAVAENRVCATVHANPIRHRGNAAGIGTSAPHSAERGTVTRPSAKLGRLWVPRGLLAAARRRIGRGWWRGKGGTEVLAAGKALGAPRAPGSGSRTGGPSREKSRRP